MQVLELLLRESDLQIADEVVQGAAMNAHSGEAIMKLLLDRQGSDLQITEKAVQTIAANDQSGETMMKLLLDRQPCLQITDR